MIMKFLKKPSEILEKIKDGAKAEEDCRNDAIVLKIVKKDETIAYLSTENAGKIFTLVYTDKFLESGVPPFNMKLSQRDQVEIGKTYKSDVLWYAFAARIPSPSRPDYPVALKRANLTGNEPILEIIGKMSPVSISRSWTLEIKKAA